MKRRFVKAKGVRERADLVAFKEYATVKVNSLKKWKVETLFVYVI